MKKELLLNGDLLKKKLDEAAGIIYDLLEGGDGEEADKWLFENGYTYHYGDLDRMTPRYDENGYNDDHPVAYDDGEWYYEDYEYDEDEPTEWEVEVEDD